MFDSFQQWAKRPFDLENMSLLDWFLLFGVFLAIAVAWGLIIRTGNELAGG